MLAVTKVMTHPITITSRATAVEATHIMWMGGFRYLPVTEKGNVGDLL